MTATPSLRYKFEFNNPLESTQDIVFTDTLQTLYNTTYGFPLSNMRGKLTLYAPDGSLICSETVIMNGSTSTWGGSLAVVPLDADGYIQQGTYVGTYAVSTNGGMSYQYTATIEIDYAYTQPAPSIVMSANIFDAELTVSDETDPIVENAGGDEITPTSSRSMKVYYPKKSDGTEWASVVTTTNASVVIGPNIYSRVWQATIALTLQYKMESWTGGDPLLIINDVVEGAEKLDIRIPSSICQLYDSMVALQSKYNSMTYNYQERERLRGYLCQINDNYRLYLIAQGCGEDYTTYCDNIQTILETLGIDCSQGDEISRVITPAAGGGGGGTPGTRGSLITMGTGAAGLPSAGQLAGDVHIFNADGGGYTQGDLYKYGSSWTYQYTVAGTSGYSGYSGQSGASMDARVIYQSVTPAATTAVTTPVTLGSYTLPGGTLANNGSSVEVYGNVIFALNGNGKTVSITWDGTTVGSYFTDNDTLLSNRDMRVYMKVTHVTDVDQNVEVGFMRNGEQRFPLYIKDNADLTGDVDIAIIGQNTEVSAGDITLDQITVVYTECDYLPT